MFKHLYFCRTSGHCLGERLDPSFEAGHILQEEWQLREEYDHFVDFLLHRIGADIVPSSSGMEPKFEEVAGTRDVGTSDPSPTRAMRISGKQQNWVVDIKTRHNQKSS